MIILVLVLAVVALAISLPVAAGMMVLSQRLGHMDQPGREAHKKHVRAVPNTGGVGIAAAIVLPMTAALLGANLLAAGVWTGWLAPVGAHIPGLVRQTSAASAVLVAVLIIHVLGLIDDRRGLGPGIKLLVQLGVGAALAIAFDMRILHLLDAWGTMGWLGSVIITSFWVAVVINAMNMLDNMDGLCGGVGGIIAGLYLAATLIGGQWFVAAQAALLLGALVGFLCLNFPNAKLFMGDGGSQVVGLMLALISIRTTYWVSEASHLGGAVPSRPGAWYGLLMPLMLMAIPLYDFTSVTLLRLARGLSPFRGDHNHFSHRLVRKGLTRTTAVIVIWLCTLATGLSGVMLATLNPWQALLAAGQTVAILAILAILERTHSHETTL